MLVKNNIKNLRNLDEKEFKKVYKYLKRKTNNFKEFNEGLIIEKNQYLLIFRIILGMSQKEFAEKLGKTKDWCRHLEAGRHKIEKLKVAGRYSWKIEGLLRKSKINLEKSLEIYKRYLFYSKDQNIAEPEIKFKPFSKMNEEDLISYFNIIKEETNNFTNFKSDLLIRIPQSLTIFRIILCLSYRKLGKILEKDHSHLKIYEHLKTRMKPITANFFITKIKNLFKNINVKKITIDKTLENFRILSGFYGNRNLDAYIKNGLIRFAKINPNKFEEEIAKLLSENNIKYKRYKILNGKKRGFNVDFLIEQNNIKIVLEVFSYSNMKKKAGVKTKVCMVDHRFQALKQKYPGLITITCIEITGKPILYNYVKKYLDMEILNTDYLLINKNKRKLIEIINNVTTHTRRPLRPPFFLVPS